jgi:hypothetical protein
MTAVRPFLRQLLQDEMSDVKLYDSAQRKLAIIAFPLNVPGIYIRYSLAHGAVVPLIFST